MGFLTTGFLTGFTGLAGPIFLGGGRGLLGCCIEVGEVD